MKQLSSLGRILFAIPFAVFGINHLVMQDFYLGMLTSFMPFGPYIIIITGLILIATSISIIAKKLVQISSWTPGNFAFSVHNNHSYSSSFRCRISPQGKITRYLYGVNFLPSPSPLCHFLCVPVYDRRIYRTDTGGTCHQRSHP